MPQDEFERAAAAKASISFKKAKNKAQTYANDSEKLNDLIDQASRKAFSKASALEAIWTQLSACFRLIRAYAKGTYREVPWNSIIAIIAAIIYFVMPFDLIPDFIAGFGLLDDAALLGWTVKAFRTEIETFLKWEAEITS